MSARVVDDHMHPHSHLQQQQHPDDTRFSAAGPSSRPAAGAGGSAPRKRASRAGTRSVSTLSPAQLERKRANDREAQRAIRQRTKEHIEKLEKRILELSSHDERNTQLLTALKRNKELEEENAMLKASLQQANYALGVSDQSGAWSQVPHLKTPIPGAGPGPGQGVRMTSQPEMRTSPQSGLSRTDSAAFPASGWQGASYGGSPMSARPFGQGSAQAQSAGSQAAQDQWRYVRGRAQTTPLADEFGKAVQQPQQQQGPAQQQQQPPPPPQPGPQTSPAQQQQMDYSSYSMPAPHQPSSGRANSQPHLFNPEEQHDQHMRHLSEQFGLGQVDYGGGGGRQQQSMMQHPPSRQSLPGMPVQSPTAYQPHSAGSAKHDATTPQQQQPMYYGPYSR